MNNRRKLVIALGIGALVGLALFAYLNGTSIDTQQLLIGVPIDTRQPVLSNAEQSAVYSQDPKALGDTYQRGLEALKRKEYLEAEKMIRLAALGGLNAAQYSLGSLYENGLGLPMDAEQACYWYRYSAHGGNLDAKKRLALPIQDKKGKNNSTTICEIEVAPPS